MGYATTPVILSGGSGTRLWPLSLPSSPKQLHALATDESMLQATVRRVMSHEGAGPPVIVCNEAQAGVIGEQLRSIGSPPAAVIVEPEGRNTAAAVAAAALVLGPDTVMAVFPADHLIADTAAFHSALAEAIDAASAGAIVTFGVVPSRPDTGFGYIRPGPGEQGVKEVAEFVEKPDVATAVRYVESGYLWNSGMFAFSAAAILEELRRFVPEVVEAAERSMPGDVEGVIRLGEAFVAAPSISLDHAVMERTDRAQVVPLDAGWSDVGSWAALWEVLAEGGDPVISGPVFVRDGERSYIRAESRPVAVIGLDDVVVVETEHAVLVVDRRRTQDVRAAAEWFQQLEGRGRARTERSV